MGRFDRQPLEFGRAPVVTQAPTTGDTRAARLEARLAALEQTLEIEREARARLAAELSLERTRIEGLEAELAGRGQRATDERSEPLESELTRAWGQIHALNASLIGRQRRRWWARG
jgi:hypothetical protein